MNFKDIIFNYYPAKIWLSAPLGVITLEQFIESHKNPKPKMRDIFDQIAKAGAEKNLELKDSLKQNNLFCFTPAIRTNNLGRKYEDITGFTGLMPVEFDKIPYAEELKHYLFRHPSCVCAYTSPSRTGCKFLFRIPIVKTVDEYKACFSGLAYHLDKFAGFDSANYNPALPLFLSLDEDMLVRYDAVEWTQRGEKLNIMVPYEGDFDTPYDIDENDTKEVIRIITRAFNKIVDNGHLQVRGASVCMGGFVGAGYISFGDAEALLFKLIENNTYLQKGIPGYKKTAQLMLHKGMSAPMLLDRHKEK